MERFKFIEFVETFHKFGYVFYFVDIFLQIQQFFLLSVLFSFDYDFFYLSKTLSRKLLEFMADNIALDFRLLYN